MDSQTDRCMQTTQVLNACCAYISGRVVIKTQAANCLLEH